jgi:Mn2+/Fe2+ NRAMP family transporter
VVAAGTNSSRRVRVRIGVTGRRALLTGHIITGVGLLGSVAVVLAINIRAATTADAQLAASSYDLLAMLTLLFGIPLSFASLISGVLLGLSSQWGVLRYGWARSCWDRAPTRCATATEERKRG